MQTRWSTFQEIGSLGADPFVDLPGDGGTCLQPGTLISREAAHLVADPLVDLPGGVRSVESRSETFREVSDLLF
jgi:hypothetical protein